MRGGAVAPIWHSFVIAAVCLLFGPIAAAESLALEIKQVRAGTDERTKEPIVQIVLTEASARIIADVSAKNIGRPLEVRVDGRAVVKAVIREPILGGSLQISGRFTRQETDDMAARLSSGSAKVEFEVVSSD